MSCFVCSASRAVIAPNWSMYAPQGRIGIVTRMMASVITTERHFRGFRLRPGDPGIGAAERALRACGYEPRLIPTGGASDANAFIAKGLPVVNLANGTERNHQPDERVSVQALEGNLDVALALLHACAEETDG